MKKRFFLPVFICGLLVVALYAKGITPTYITAAPQMLVGFTAKMSCSLKYVAKLPETKIAKDIALYSPLFQLPDVTYDDAKGYVVSRFAGEVKYAQYREGLGCTLLSGVPASAELEGESFIQLPTLYTTNSVHEVIEDNLLSKKLSGLLHDDNDDGLDTRALLLMNKKGSVLAEAYADGFNRDSVFLGWSMAKTFTATLIGSLQYRNALYQVPPLFPSWALDERKDITLEHMLTMTTGLDFEEVYSPGTDATNMLFVDASSVSRPLASLVQSNAGTHWSYSSGTANLLAALAFEALAYGDVTMATERSLDYVAEYLLHPLGMTSAVLELDASGQFVGSSFMFANAKDWASLGALYLNNGQFNDYQILAPEWVAKATAPNTSQNESRYGYQLWLNQGGNSEPLRWPDVPPKSFAARGNKGQLVMVVPEKDLVVVRLGWSGGEYPVNDLMRRVLRSLGGLQ